MVFQVLFLRLGEVQVDVPGAFIFGANCTMKKWNMKRWVEDGGTVDRVILGLNDKDALEVMKYCELFLRNFTGDPRTNMGKYRIYH